MQNLYATTNNWHLLDIGLIIPSKFEFTYIGFYIRKYK